MMRPDELERAARIVVDSGYQIHRDLGPGLLESAYEALLAETTRQAGLTVERQVSVAMVHKGVVVDNAFRIDLLVENTLVVEVKSIERLAPVHGKQVLTYLRLMQLPPRPAHELQSGDLQRGPAAHRQRLLRTDRLAPPPSCLRVNPATLRQQETVFLHRPNLLL